ncbi:MAG: serine hydrolase [Bacteroidota bacterium]
MSKTYYILLCLYLFGHYVHGQLNFEARKTLTIKVDSIIHDGIQQNAFPGAQLLVAYKDSIVFHKTYGFHTYDSLVPVQADDLYDLASVTKILGPLPALIKLVGDKQLDLDQPFSEYWKPWRKFKAKKNLTLREILAHQAGLTPYIVFLNTVRTKNGTLKARFVRKQASKRFQKQVYEGLYVKNRFENKVFRNINRSKVSHDKKYRYSGLTFLIFPKLIEQLTGKGYEVYLKEEFYDPIGAGTLGFNPLRKGITNPIVPTENDTLFRHTLTKGWVHDENAALLGGVSGNAGLFGTARDVLKMMHLYQNLGKFNGKRVLKKATVEEFIAIQYPENDNRRGLGFDKPLLGNDTLRLSEAYPAPRASPQSFGHAGFTGTFVWADPEHELIFIFLSNRVYPTRENRGLYSLNIRPKLHQLFYCALID